MSAYMFVVCRSCKVRENVYVGDIYTEHFNLECELLEMHCDECIKKGRAAI